MHSVFGVATEMTNPELKKEIMDLKNKYIKIEFDPTMSIEEKIPHMEDWWNESHKFIVKHKFPKSLIEQALYKSRVQFRGSHFFLFFCQKEIF